MHNYSSQLLFYTRILHISGILCTFLAYFSLSLLTKIYTMQKTRNPFLNTLVIPYIQYVTSTKLLLAEDIATKKFGFEVDSHSFTRLYNTKAHREFIFSLSKHARDMFLALQYCTIKDMDYLILNRDKINSIYSPLVLGKRRYEDTVRELVRTSVIDLRDRKDSSYWYNPIYFCAGNRLDMYEQCKVKVLTKHINPRELAS